MELNTANTTQPFIWGEISDTSVPPGQYFNNTLGNLQVSSGGAFSVSSRLEAVYLHFFSRAGVYWKSHP